MEHLTNRQWLEIGIAVGGSIVLGWLIRQFVFPYLIRLSRKTKWRSDDLVLESTSKWIVFWFLLGACVYILPILTGTFEYARKREVFLHNIIGALYIFSFTWVIARIVAGLLQIRGKRDDHEFASTSILGNIARAIVFCIGLILILQTFGVAIAPLLTALGVGGIAVALALQPTLSNLFSGLQLIASGKINIGDLVRLEGGQMGIIRDITWRNTTIETGQHNIVVVPNSKMADSIIENFYLTDHKISYTIPIRVGYDCDLELVERISSQVAKEILETNAGGVPGFEPFVRFQKFGESAIEFIIVLEVKEYADQFLITSQYIKALHKRYRQEGIKIPFPVRTILMEKPE
jgi:small-conductance mechanosensitive channel